MLLNILPTHAYLHNIYPHIFTSSNCYSCNNLESSSYWYTCPNHTSLTQIINTSIHDTFTNANLNLSSHQLNNLIHTISSHPAFNLQPSQLYPFFLNSTLKGLIPISLIQSLDPFEISYSNASQLIIQLLLKISNQLYSNIWIPYCINFSNWKKSHQIPSYSNFNTPPHSSLRSINRRNKTNYTYSCPCGTADQLHSETNTCPPLGQATLKINTWSTMWIKYNTPINQILTIQT